MENIYKLTDEQRNFLNRTISYDLYSKYNIDNTLLNILDKGEYNETSRTMLLLLRIEYIETEYKTEGYNNTFK